MSPQPPRRPVRRPHRNVTSLKPGDILAYQTPSGRFHLLAVRALAEHRAGTFPVVRLLDYHEQRLPGPGQLAELRDQPGASSYQAAYWAAVLGSPWQEVGGLVDHWRGHDFSDCGFQIIGHVPPPSQAEQHWVLSSISSGSSWAGWQNYLKWEDKKLDEPQATGLNDRHPSS
jgi:hypothetical protein